jgi:hypothetical protein
MILIVPLPDGGVDRLITSQVQRVLINPNGIVFVETRQSVYRVTPDEPIAVLPPPPRMRPSFDSFDLTIAPDSLLDDTSEDAEESD